VSNESVRARRNEGYVRAKVTDSNGGTAWLQPSFSGWHSSVSAIAASAPPSNASIVGDITGMARAGSAVNACVVPSFAPLLSTAVVETVAVLL
jgi:hypothetical protein